MGKKTNYCPHCGSRLKHYKCHVCGENLAWGKELQRVYGHKWKYAESVQHNDDEPTF